MKKFKRIMILLLASIIAIFSLNNFRANAKDAQGKTDGDIVYHYNVYSKEDWDTAQNARIIGQYGKIFTLDEVAGYITQYNALPPFAKNLQFWSDKGLDVAIDDAYLTKNSDGSYSQTYAGYADGGATAPTTSRGATPDAIKDALQAEIDSKRLSAFPTKTSVQPGDDIVIVVNAELVGGHGGFKSAVVALDIQKYADGSITTYRNEDLIKGASYTPSVTSANGAPLLGWTSPSVNTNTPSPAYLGALGFKVKSGVSSLKIEYYKNAPNNAENNFCDSEASATSISAASHSSRFSEDDLTLTVDGGSNAVNLTDITVEGTSCFTSATSATVNGDSTSKYKGKEVDDGTANVTVTVADNGKIVTNTVKYGTSIANATNAASNVTSQGFTVDMSGIQPGQSYYAIFQVQSSDNTTFKWYAVELVKAKDKNCDLSGVTFTGTDPSTAAAVISISPAFSPSTTGYDVYVPKGTTNLKVTPTYDSTLKTCKFFNPSTQTLAQASSINSGTASSVITWTDGYKIKLRVTAQDEETSKDYTFTIKEVNMKPTNVQVTSGTFSGSDTDADGNNEYVINDLPFKSNTFTLRPTFPNMSVIDTMKVYQDGSLTTFDKNNLNWSINMPDNGNATASTTITVEVTSTTGVTQTYTFVVNRKAADTNKAINSITINANNGSNTLICNSFTGTALNINYPGGATELPLTYGSFTVAATAASSLATVTIKINGNTQNSFNFSGAAAQTIPVSITVAAENGDSTTYTGNVKRAGADNDGTFTFTNLNYTYADENGNIQSGNYVDLVLDNGTYTNSSHKLEYLTKSITYQVVPTKSTTKVFVSGVDRTGQDNTLQGTAITFGPASQTIRVYFTIKTEADQINNSTGTTYSIDFQAYGPDGTKEITKLELLKATDSTVITPTNTTQGTDTYTYTLKRTEVGTQFKLDLEWNSSTTDCYVSTSNNLSVSQMTAANAYKSTDVYNIGTKYYIYLKAQDQTTIKYTLDVKFADERSTENGIANVVITDKDGDVIFNSFVESQTSYPTTSTIKISYDKAPITFEVTVKDDKETLQTGNNYISGTLTNKVTTVTVTPTSGTTTTYKVQGVAEKDNVRGTEYSFKIERDGPDDDNTFTFTDLEYTYVDENGITQNGNYQNLTLSSGVYTNTTHTLPYLTKTISFKVVPTSSKTKVYIGTTDITNQIYTIDPADFSSVAGQRIRQTFRVKTERDQVNYPNAAQGGTTVTLSFQGEGPDSTKNITKLALLHASNGDDITPSTNSTSGTNTYTYTLKTSEVGSQFKLDLEWESSTTECFVTNVDSTTQMTAANKYNPDKTYNVDTKYYIFLKSQDGTNARFTLDVKSADERSTECGIANVVIKDKNGDIIFNDFAETLFAYPTSAATIVIPYTNDALTFEVTVKDSKEKLVAGSTSTVKYISGTPADNLVATVTVTPAVGITTYKVQGEAEHGEKGSEYSFKIEREEAATGNYIETLSINGVDCFTPASSSSNYDYDFDKTAGQSFSIYFPLGTNNFAASFTVSPKAKFTITTDVTGSSTTSPFNFSVADGSVVTLTITVKSEAEYTSNPEGNGRKYTIRVYVADTDSTLSDIKIYAADDDRTELVDTDGNLFQFNPSTTSYTFTVPYKSSNSFFLPEKAGFVGSVSINNTSLASLTVGYPKPLTNTGTTYPVKVEVTSQLAVLAKTDAKVKKDDRSTTYIINIKREAGSSDATLKTLEIYIDGMLKTFSVNGNPQTFTPGYAGPYMVENVGTSSNSASITAIPNDDKAKIISGDGTRTISLSDGTSVQEFDIVCEAEDGTQKTYTIKLWKNNANPSSDKSLSSIVATVGTNLAQDRLSPFFSQGIHQYNINLTAVEEEVKLTITKGHANSMVYVTSGLINASSKAIPYEYVVQVAAGSTVVYKVYITAEDGTSTESDGAYEITISREAADNDATLKEFKINGNTVTGFTDGDHGKTYTVNIGDATTAYLEGVTSKTTSKIISNPCPSATPATLDYGMNSFVVRTQAQDGTTEETYTVLVIKDYPKTIDTLHAMVKDEDGIPSNKLQPGFDSTVLTGYSVKLEHEQTEVELRFTSQYYGTGDPYANTISVFGPSGNEITGNNGIINLTNIPTGSNDYKVRVKSVSGKTQDYVITITRDAGSDDNTIATYHYQAKNSDTEKTNLPIEAGKVNYVYAVDRDMLDFSDAFIDIVPTDPKATIIWPTDTTMTAGMINNKVVTVVSQTGKEKKYTFSVYPCDTNFEITDVNALDKDDNTKNIIDVDGASFIDYENDHLSITVPNSTSQTYLEVVGGGTNSVIYVNNAVYTNQIVSLSEGANTFAIYILSEYGKANPSATDAKSDIVTVTITRQRVSTDSTLKKLVVTYKDANGVTQRFEHDGLPANSLLAIPNVGDNISDIHIEAIPNDPNATVSGDGTQQTFDPESATENYTVVCTAEDGVTKTSYPIKIARGDIDSKKDNSLTYIEVSDGTGTQHLGQSNFNPSTTSYGTYKIPYDAQNYTITVVKPGWTSSTVLINNETVASNTITKNILNSERGTTIQVPVQVVAEDSTKGTEYIIELEFESPSTNALLNDLKADGATVPGFNPTDQGGHYVLPTRPNTTTSIEIECTPADSKSTVTGTGTFNLNEGNNVFSVVVKPQFGDSYQYTIEVRRDYPLPYLTDLAVEGEKLLNEQDKTTTFDKEVYTYHVTVDYMTLYATIKASVDNKDFVVTCSNSTINSQADFLRTFDVNLAEGKNDFTITVTSKEGKTVEYHLVIRRLGKASTNTEVASIEILQIPEFKTDYTNDTREYTYEVPNGIKNLDVKVTPAKQKDADGDGATYKIINGRNSGEITDENVSLRVGKNTLVVLIIAEDGETTRAILVEVNRAPISFTVNTEAYEDFTCEKKENGDYAYHIDLGNKRASDIEDYTKYIVFDTEDYDDSNRYVELPEVTVISDTSNKNCNEVVVRIYDGDEEVFVTFELESTAFGGSTIPEILQIIMPWILIAIAIIILIIILICVNRDKFGAINKKRKKDDEQE